MQIELSVENVRWFKTHYPSASLAWILDSLLQSFRNCCEHTPQEYIDAGARELKKLLDSNSVESIKISGDA